MASPSAIDISCPVDPSRICGYLEEIQMFYGTPEITDPAPAALPEYFKGDLSLGLLKAAEVEIAARIGGCDVERLPITAELTECPVAIRMKNSIPRQAARHIGRSLFGIKSSKQ